MEDGRAVVSWCEERTKKMGNLSEFCTCKNLECPLHPTKHDKGCAPCIRKNLKLKEVPNCFFDLVENADCRSGDSFGDFAHLMMENARQKGA